MAHLPTSIERELREMGIMPDPHITYREPSYEETQSKNFYNTHNLTRNGDGTYTPNF